MLVGTAQLQGLAALGHVVLRFGKLECKAFSWAHYTLSRRAQEAESQSLSGWVTGAGAGHGDRRDRGPLPIEAMSRPCSGEGE